MQRFIRINSTNIDRKHKVTRIKGCTSVLELTGRPGSSELTGHIILLKLTEHISLGASTGCTDLLN